MGGRAVPDDSRDRAVHYQSKPFSKKLDGLIREQVRGLKFGTVNETAYLFAEYVRRKQLYGIGIVDNITNIPFWKAEAFAIIAEELDLAEKRETEKAKSKGGKRRGR